MSKRKLRDLTAVFFVGLFLMTWEPVFIWLLVGGLVLLQPDSREDSNEEKTSSKNLLQLIREDARRFGVKMPQRQSRRSLLLQIYGQYEEAKRQYPHLKCEYREVINEMWTSLAADANPHHWNQVLTSVIADWPTRGTTAPSQGVKEKLQRVKELSQQWDEAKREAMGGANV